MHNAQIAPSQKHCDRKKITTTSNRQHTKVSSDFLLQIDLQMIKIFMMTKSYPKRKFVDNFSTKSFAVLANFCSFAESKNHYPPPVGFISNIKTPKHQHDTDSR